MFDDAGQSEGKIGAKKLRKQQEKAEKKRQREVSLFLHVDLLPGILEVHL